MKPLIYKPHWSDFVAETPAKQISKSLASAMVGGWADAIASAKARENAQRASERELKQLQAKMQMQLQSELLQDMLKGKSLYRVMESGTDDDAWAELRQYIDPGEYTIAEIKENVPADVYKRTMQRVDAVAPIAGDSIIIPPAPAKQITYTPLSPSEIAKYIADIAQGKTPPDADKIIIVDDSRKDKQGKIWRVEGTELIDTGRVSPTGSHMYEVPQRIYNPKTDTWETSYILSTTPTPKEDTVPLSYDDKMALARAQMMTREEYEQEKLLKKKLSELENLNKKSDMARQSLISAREIVLRDERLVKDFNDALIQALSKAKDNPGITTSLRLGPISVKNLILGRDNALDKLDEHEKRTVKSAIVDYVNYAEEARKYFGGNYPGQLLQLDIGSSAWRDVIDTSNKAVWDYYLGRAQAPQQQPKQQLIPRAAPQQSQQQKQSTPRPTKKEEL